MFTFNGKQDSHFLKELSGLNFLQNDQDARDISVRDVQCNDIFNAVYEERMAAWERGGRVGDTDPFGNIPSPARGSRPYAPVL